MIRATGLIVLISLLSAVALPGEDFYAAGRDAERLGNWPVAIESYAKCSAEKGPLAPFARMRAAVCRFQVGDEAGGVEQLRQLLAEMPDGPWVRQAEYELAMMLVNRHLRLEAAGHFHSALETDADLWWLDNYRWTAADNAITQDETRELGYAFFRDYSVRTLWRQPRLDAAERLAASPYLQDRIAAANAFLFSREDKGAQRVIESSVHLAADAESSRALTLLSARFDIANRQADRGTRILTELIADNPKSDFAREAMAQSIRELLRAGRVLDAETMALKLAEHHPDTKEAGDARWSVAGTFERSNRPDDAIRHYKALAEQQPAHDRADDALLRLGIVYESIGSSREALDAYDAVADRFPLRNSAAEAAYRAADLLERTSAGDQVIARLETASDHGLGQFFGHRAQERLVEFGHEGSVSTRNLRVAGNESFVRPIGQAREEPFDPFAGMTGAVRFERLRFFASHGYPEAEWEALYLAGVLTEGEDRRALLAAMAESGVAYSAMQLAAAENWGVDENGIPTLERRRIDFPRAYWSRVREVAAEARVDPYLLLAMARQESTYRPALVSVAGAAGVMQVMPSTAQWMLRTDPRVTQADIDNLMNPHNSLRLGAIYLRMMLDRSGGNVVYALASYNAGPGNCDKWRRANPTTNMAEFIEKIPFEETREYVKRVLGYYAAYHSLYPPAD